MTEVRKVHLAKDKIQRPPINSVKVSGDDGGKPQAIHKNRNKIPKALRYDLENALVQLCDVWFEEIKPYLIRNNIKLHVHGAEAGDGDREAAPECSHVDPGTPDQRQRRGANCAGCCSTPQTASRARCRRPPPQHASSASPETSTERPCPNFAKEQTKPRRRRRKTVSQSSPRPPVPRLCRTYSIPPDNTLTEPAVRNNTGLHLQKSVHRCKLRYSSPKPKQFKDTSTQTDIKVKYWEKGKEVKSRYKQERSQSPPVQKCNEKPDEPNTENKKFLPRSLSPQFGKGQAWTAFSPPKMNKREKALYQDDLIDIISEKLDKKLKVLYTSPVQEEYPFILNLYSPTCNSLTPRKIKIPRLPLWR